LRVAVEKDRPDVAVDVVDFCDGDNLQQQLLRLVEDLAFFLPIEHSVKVNRRPNIVVENEKTERQECKEGGSIKRRVDFTVVDEHLSVLVGFGSHPHAFEDSDEGRTTTEDVDEH
jgi:hypothetical protein